MDSTDVLARLRDVAAPPAPPETSLLPLAIVAALLSVLTGLIVVLILRRRRTWRSEALARLDGLASLDRATALAEAAALLRRIAILKSGGSAARLTGDAWLTHLDGLFRTRFFTDGKGRAFGDNLYQRESAPPPMAELRTMIRRRGLLPW